MEELRPSFRRVASMLWLMLWRGVVGGTIFAVLVATVTGFLAAFAAFYFTGNPDPELGKQAGEVTGLILAPPLAILWAMVILRMALTKKYRGFRVALISTDPPIVQ